MNFQVATKSMNNSQLPGDKDSIVRERIRQAHHSFNLALAATTASFLISIVGAGLLFANKVPEGGTATAGGLLSSVGFIKFAKDANDRLDLIYGELDED
jgi:hypothetical protein